MLPDEPSDGALRTVFYRNSTLRDSTKRAPATIISDMPFDTAANGTISSSISAFRYGPSGQYRLRQHWNLRQFGNV
jgi:hypothetical protein